MSQIEDQRDSMDAKNASQLQRRVRTMATVGLLLTSVIIGGIATYLLHRSSSDVLTGQLAFAVRLQVSAMEAELGRLYNLAAQIPSRTQIRRELERFNRGEVSREALVKFTVPKLTDAMDSNADMIGITRLLPNLEPVLHVGEPIDRLDWPSQPAGPGLRLGLPRDGRVVVSAPIHNRDGEFVGVDLVKFKDDRLHSVMQDFFSQIETHGEVQIITAVDGDIAHFYDGSRSGSRMAVDPGIMKAELPELLSHKPIPRLHVPKGRTSDDVMVMHQPIGDTGWVFMFYTNPRQFFSAASKQAASVAFAVAFIALLGIVFTIRAIQPLFDRISAETRHLQQLLRQNESLLENVQASERMLYAVIDNAPAVIYMKDRDGRYILVNDSFERLLGLPSSAILGKRDVDLFPGDAANAVREMDLEVMSSGRSTTIDERTPQHNLAAEYLSTRFPLLDNKGEVNGICGIATDITERKRTERRLALTQATVDKASVGVLWADADGRLIYLNHAAREALRLGERPCADLSIGDIAPSFGGDAWAAHWQRIAHTGSLHYEAEFRRQDGSTYPVAVYANHLARADEPFYIALVHDISERRESETKLRQSATVFDCTAEAIVITDTKARVLDVNAAFTAMSGYTRDEVLGRNPSFWKSNIHNQEFYAGMWASVLDTGEWRGEIINRNKDGSLAPALSTINTVRDTDGTPTAYVAIYTDISQIKASQEQLAHLAHHDALTDLPNRVLFNERLQHSLDRSARRGGRVAVVFVDLDNFKNVNDSLGHLYGDKLLIEVAGILKSVLRSDDTVARIGGDEFTILIEDVGERNALIMVVEKIIDAFDREFPLGGSVVRVTPSLGISISPDDGKDAQTLMRNADAAMYRAKALGRNTYQFYTQELTQLAFERIHLDAAMRNAIPRREFEIFYQPQLDLTSKRLIGMEVLARWQHPELGVVRPDVFIPIAEDNGLILPLGEWILEQACRQAKRWLDAGLDVGTVAVNISGVQVRRGSLPETVARVLQASGLEPGYLELEVTESAIMGDSQNAIDVLHELRRIGVTLAVDDFGTGYSSLSYLKSLPVHRIKIDKSFVRDIPDDANDVAITRAVIALAKSLNLEPIGEGVETEEQRRFLIAEGCLSGQGFLFDPPLNAAAMQARLEVLQDTAGSSPRPVHTD